MLYFVITSRAVNMYLNSLLGVFNGPCASICIIAKGLLGVVAVDGVDLYALCM